ncbi:hypothetical protein CSKR_102015, partial [Clonorchis sinensis]
LMPRSTHADGIYGQRALLQVELGPDDCNLRASEHILVVRHQFMSSWLTQTMSEHNSKSRKKEDFLPTKMIETTTYRSTSFEFVAVLQHKSSNTSGCCCNEHDRQPDQKKTGTIKSFSAPKDMRIIKQYFNSFSNWSFFQPCIVSKAHLPGTHNDP